MEWGFETNIGPGSFDRREISGRHDESPKKAATEAAAGRDILGEALSGRMVSSATAATPVVEGVSALGQPAKRCG